MPNAIWRGNISFGLVSIPVSLLAAETRNELSFHLLDGRDLSPIHNKRVNESTGEEVAWEDIVKGYEREKGSWVVLTDDDFRAANVEATQTIDVLGAVCASDIPLEYFERPYFLEPMKAGRKAYALLRETLRRAERVAIGRVVVRTRQRLVAIVPHGDMLLLEMLRYPHELRDSAQLDLPPADVNKAGVTEAELRMAEQLVEAMQAEWTPEEYRDTYRDDILALIEKKAKAGPKAAPAAPPPEFEPSAEVVDIMSLLKKSLEKAETNVSDSGRSGRAGKGGHGKTASAKSGSTRSGGGKRKRASGE